MIFTKISARKRTESFTLVEAMVVMVLLSLISVAILRASIMVMKNAHLNRNKMAAVNMMQKQIETIQGMSYNRIGIHPGDNIGFINRDVLSNDVYDVTNDVLMSNSVVLSDMGTTNISDDINGTLITYVWNVDDAFDGTGGSDADGDTNDYKRIRVQIAWNHMGNHYTNFVETIAYGIFGDDIPYDPTGGGTNPPGSGDPTGIVEIVKAEYATKDQKLTVEATDSEGEGASVLTVAGGYSPVMTYDSKKDKYKYDGKGVPDPGANVTVTSDSGGSDTYPTTYKK